MVEARRTHTLLRSWRRRATDVPVAGTTVVAFVVAFARDQQGPGVVMPGRRPAHTVGAVTADQWVDDLEIERWATTRGSNPSASALLTSTNTETMITSGREGTPVVAFLVACDPRGDSPGDLSHRIVAGARSGSLGAVRTVHLVAGATLRRHGLGVHGGGFAWSAGDPGSEGCCG